MEILLKLTAGRFTLAFQPCMPEVCQAISNALAPVYLKFPTSEKFIQIARHFYLTNFPNCIGCLGKISCRFIDCFFLINNIYLSIKMVNT